MESSGEEKRQTVRIGGMNRVEGIDYEGLGALDIGYDAMGRAVRFDTGGDVIEVEYAGPDRIARIVSQATRAVWSPVEGGERRPQAADTRREVLQNDPAAPSHPGYGILEMEFDGRKKRKRTYKHAVTNVTTVPRWSPDWHGLLAGANRMTVTVAVAVDELVLTASKSGYQIHGQNPTQGQIFAHANLLEEKATCWYESSFRQFNAPKYMGIGLPLLGEPDGWGLMQRDPLPSEAHLWNWETNIREGTAYLEVMRSDAYSYLYEGYRLDKKAGKTWSWQPAKNGPKVWDDAFSRYHDGNTMYRSERKGGTVGNGGQINKTKNLNGRRAACIVRCYMNKQPWAQSNPNAVQSQCASSCRNP